MAQYSINDRLLVFREEADDEVEVIVLNIEEDGDAGARSPDEREPSLYTVQSVVDVEDIFVVDDIAVLEHFNPITEDNTTVQIENPFAEDWLEGDSARTEEEELQASEDRPITEGITITTNNTFVGSADPIDRSAFSREAIEESIGILQGRRIRTNTDEISINPGLWQQSQRPISMMWRQPQAVNNPVPINSAIDGGLTDPVPEELVGNITVQANEEYEQLPIHTTYREGVGIGNLTTSHFTMTHRSGNHYAFELRNGTTIYPVRMRNELVNIWISHDGTRWTNQHMDSTVNNFREQSIRDWAGQYWITIQDLHTLRRLRERSLNLSEAIPSSRKSRKKLYRKHPIPELKDPEYYASKEYIA